MSNFHSDEWVMNKIQEHLNESLLTYPETNIVGIFCQGSTNYGLDTEHSDVDTKLIVTPSFKDIALNKKPVSTTHIRANEEHIDYKDIRLYMETFRKQNLNFLEILFTPYFWVNPPYKDEWGRLVKERESIARMNPYRAVKSMKGIAMEKYHAMCHPYPSKLKLLEEHLYDGKQVHHLLRVEDYLRRYIAGESYEDCLHPTADVVPLLLDLKLQKIPYEQGQKLADESIARVTKMADEFCSIRKDEEDSDMRELLEDVQYNIMKFSVERELDNEEFLF